MPDQPASEPPDEMRERLDATERLLAAHKFRHASVILAAQNGEEVGPEGIAALQKMHKLEVSITSMSSFLRLREMTREPTR